MSCNNRQHLCRVRAAMLAVAVCALNMLASHASADTLRSALYQFELSASHSLQADPTPAEPEVYLRVSNAPHIISDPGAPYRTQPVEGVRGTALFEFFVAHNPASGSLSQVRLLQRSEPAHSLRRLQMVFTSGVRRPHTAAPAASLGCGRDLLRRDAYTEFVVDTGDGDLIGLLFDLAPGESIDTLIDDHLARGEILPQVRVAPSASGVHVQAVVVRRIDTGGQDDRPWGRVLIQRTEVATTGTCASSDALPGTGLSLGSNRNSQHTPPEGPRATAARIPRTSLARGPPHFADST